MNLRNRKGKYWTLSAVLAAALFLQLSAGTVPAAEVCAAERSVECRTKTVEESVVAQQQTSEVSAAVSKQMAELQDTGMETADMTEEAADEVLSSAEEAVDETIASAAVAVDEAAAPVEEAASVTISSAGEEQTLGQQDGSASPDQPGNRIYTITYELNGGTQAEGNPTAYTEESPQMLLQPPARKGYSFAGWFSDAACTEQVFSLGGGSSTGDLILYAAWEANVYSLRFKGNGADSGSMAWVKDIRYDQEITLPANVFYRRGYYFNGWNTRADGTGVSYSNKAVVKNLTTGSGRTLYAQWKTRKYTITYELKGGSNAEGNPGKYTLLTKTITLQEPTRKGYVFLGWFSDSACTKQVTKLKQGRIGNRTLYAKWKNCRYTVRFYGNGATSGTMKAMTQRTNKLYNLTANAFQRKGYKFTGWNTKADGSGTSYKDAQAVRNLRYKNGGIVRLYAQWKLRTYTITYVLNGGTNSKKNPSTYTIETPTFKLYKPTTTEEGMVFAGWYLDAAYTKKVTKIAQGRYGHKTLYAKWTKDITGNLCDYLQSDPQWAWCSYAGGTMANSGCGPTACADISGETPYTVSVWLTANGYASNGSGTYWEGPTAYLTAKGLHGKQYNYSSLYGTDACNARNRWLSAMKAGKSYGILLMGPGMFTSGGHFIVIAAVDENNRCYVLDPATHSRSGWHDWSDFAGCVKVYYSCDR